MPTASGAAFYSWWRACIPSVSRAPHDVVFSCDSMMAADEALARKYMEEMEREEQNRATERAQTEEGHFQVQACHDWGTLLLTASCLALNHSSGFRSEAMMR